MIDKLIGPVTGLLDKFIEDKDQKARLAHDLATMADQHAQEIAKGQMAINQVEAAHKSLFVSGWRPAYGWVCVLACSGNFHGHYPFTNFVLAYIGSRHSSASHSPRHHDARFNGYARIRSNEVIRKEKFGT